MKPKSFLSICIVVAALSVPTAIAQTLHFDVKGTTSGSGVVDASSCNWSDADWAEGNTRLSGFLKVVK